MGIHDRDYARPEPRGGFGGSGGAGGIPPGAFRPRGWSVNTWLIALCVAVFVIDQFLPPMLASVRFVEVAVGTDGTVRPVPERAEVDVPISYRGTIFRTLSSVGPKDRFWTSVTGPDGVRMYRPIVGVTAEAIRQGKAPRPLLLEVGQGGSFTYLDPDGNRRSADYAVLADVMPAPLIWTVGYFSTSKAIMEWVPGAGVRGFEFWRFITFQFLHANLSHLLFNMLGLYFFGSLVEQYLGSKRYLAFYLLCGIAGAAMYLVLNVIGWAVVSTTGIESYGLLVNEPGTPLVGASAGVFGVLMASAFLVPNATVLLFFVIPMRLATLAYGLVAVALFTVFFGRDNAGGEAAHLGGAIAGYWFIRHPHSLHGFFDFLGRYDPTSRSGAAYRAGKAKSRGATTLDDAEIDRILAKIHDQGLQSLTAREKRALREASKR